MEEDEATDRVGRGWRAELEVRFSFELRHFSFTLLLPVSVGLYGILVDRVREQTSTTRLRSEMY